MRFCEAGHRDDAQVLYDSSTSYGRQAAHARSFGVSRQRAAEGGRFPLTPASRTMTISSTAFDIGRSPSSGEAGTRTAGVGASDEPARHRDIGDVAAIGQLTQHRTDTFVQSRSRSARPYFRGTD